MNDKLTAVAARRQKLILKAAAQRAVLSQNMEPLRRPLVIADRGLQVARYFKQHPVLMLSTSALSGLILRKIHLARFTALLQTGWSTFQLVRNIRQSLRKD